MEAEYEERHLAVEAYPVGVVDLRGVQVENLAED